MRLGGGEMPVLFLLSLCDEGSALPPSPWDSSAQGRLGKAWRPPSTVASNRGSCCLLECWQFLQGVESCGTISMGQSEKMASYLALAWWGVLL